MKDPWKNQTQPVTNSIKSEPSKQPKSIPLEKITVEQDEKPKPQRDPGSLVSDVNVTIAPLLRHLEIKRPTSEEQLKLTEIWDYARQNAKGKSDQDAILAFVRLKNQLGSPKIGESTIDRVYRFIRIKKQQQILKEEAKSV